MAKKLKFLSYHSVQECQKRMNNAKLFNRQEGYFFWFKHSPMLIAETWHDDVEIKLMVLNVFVQSVYKGTFKREQNGSILDGIVLDYDTTANYFAKRYVMLKIILPFFLFVVFLFILLSGILPELFSIAIPCAIAAFVLLLLVGIFATNLYFEENSGYSDIQIAKFIETTMEAKLISQL